jgi:hypothetical protein
MRLSTEDPDLWKVEVAAKTVNIQRIRKIGLARVSEIAEREKELRTQTARAEAVKTPCEEARQARASATTPAQKTELKDKFNEAYAQVETLKGWVQWTEKDLAQLKREEIGLRGKFVEEVT